MYTDIRIIEILNKSGYPCWILKFREGKYGTLRNCFTHAPRKTKSDPVDMEESIRVLQEQLELMGGNSDLSFELTIKDIASSTPNNGDQLGPYAFFIEADKKEPATAVNGLSGADTSGGPGFNTWQEYMDAKLALSEDRGMFKLEKVQFENEKAREWEKINAEIKRLAELEKEYTSDVARAKKGASMAFRGVLDGLLGDEDKKALGSAEVDVKQEPLTEAEKMAESIGEHIADSTEDLTVIKQIGTVVAKMCKFPKMIPVFLKYKLPTENTPET